MVMVPGYGPKEEWREIPGWSGYEASSLGNIRSWRKPGGCRGKPGTWLKREQLILLMQTLHFGRKSERGASQRVSLGRGTAVSVARLVLMAFVGLPTDEKPYALHGDDDPGNNTLDNLRWGSARENSDDARKNGLIPPAKIGFCPHCGEEIQIVNGIELRGGQ